MKIEDEKILSYTKMLCIGQFVVLLIVTYFIPSLDKKFILFLSAVLGILAYGAANRSFVKHRVDETTQKLSDDFYRTGVSKDSEKEDPRE